MKKPLFLSFVLTVLSISVSAQEIKTEYSRFEDKTIVSADLQERSLDFYYLNASLMSIHDGKPSQGDYAMVLMLGLSSVMGRFPVDESPRLIAITDEERLVLPTLRVMPGTRGELRVEFFRASLSSETMAKMAKAKSVELYLVPGQGAEPMTFKLTDADQKLLTAFSNAVRGAK
jgi:hypothetical protein